MFATNFCNDFMSKFHDRSGIIDEKDDFSTDDEPFDSGDEALHSARTPFVLKTNKIVPSAGSSGAGKHSARTEYSHPNFMSSKEPEANGALCLRGYLDLKILYADMNRPFSLDSDLTIMCCQYNKSNNYLALGLSNGVIEVLKDNSKVQSSHNQEDIVKNVHICYTLRDKSTMGSTVNCMCLTWYTTENDNFIIACYTNGMVKMWHPSTSTAIISIDENKLMCQDEYLNAYSYTDYSKSERQTMTLAVNSVGSHLITGGSDGVICVYSITQPTSSEKRSFKFLKYCSHSGSKDCMDGHCMKILSIIFHPDDPTTFYSSGWDARIFEWSLHRDEKHFINRFVGPQICSHENLDIDISSAGILQMICASHNEANIIVINLRNGEELCSMRFPLGKGTHPYCVNYISDKLLLVGGSHPNSLRAIERKSMGHDMEVQVFGSLVDLDFAVSCIALGGEDKNKKINVATCSGSMVIFLTCPKRQ